MGLRLTQHRLRFHVEQLYVALFVSSHQQLPIGTEVPRIRDVQKTGKHLDLLTRLARIQSHTNAQPPHFASHFVPDVAA